MKALTLWQPWASLVALEAKRWETRSWATSHRGPIAIHAARRWRLEQTTMCSYEPFRSALRLEGLASIHVILGSLRLHLGKVLCIADLVDCVETGPELWERIRAGSNERAFGDYSLGRFAWRLENVRRIKPVEARGRQRLWNWDGPYELVEVAA